MQREAAGAMTIEDKEIQNFCDCIWRIHQDSLHRTGVPVGSARFECLLALGRSPTLSLGYAELEQTLDKPTRTVQHIVAELRRAGLCRLVASSSDRRFRHIALTESGRDLLHDHIVCVAANLRLPQGLDIGAHDSP
jgi:DNA-binding MarR family transcriptional regulator